MGGRYLYDIETNGLLDTLDKVHSLVVLDLDKGELLSFADQPGYRPVEEGVRLLQTADLRGGHNILKFDEWALAKVYPWFTPNPCPTRVFDTLLAARLLWGDLMDSDLGRIKRGTLPGRLRGSYTLEAWGYRLGCWKGEYAEIKAREIKAEHPDWDKAKVTEEVWRAWDKPMQDYCEQDVWATEKLYSAVVRKGLPPIAWMDETKAAILCAKITANGYPFREDKAADLYASLAGARAAIEAELKDYFGVWWESEGEYTPKNALSTQGYWGDAWYEFVDNGEHVPPEMLTKSGKPNMVAQQRGTRRVFFGYPLTKVRLVTFNPSSRHHIANRLTKLYGWEPTEFTPDGQPKLDEDILAALPYPCAPLLTRYFLVEKRIGQLAEGKNAWLQKARNGRIHGSYNSLGAVTRRATHSDPNIAQVPKVQKDKTGILYGEPGGWGFECRDLFYPGKGWWQVGADASGLELRCLAHFMGRWDGGEYAKVLLEGDIHSVNQEAAGLPTRDNAKTFIYGFLYGAGDEKIGSIVGKDAAEGKRLKTKFLAGLPALKNLIDAVRLAAKRHGNIKSLDDGLIYVRSQHAALNTLLQSAGALICKRWIVVLEQMLLDRGLKHGWDGDFAFLAWVHDEVQVACRTEETAKLVAELAQAAMKEVEAYYNFKCPLDTEAKIGKSWAECH